MRGNIRWSSRSYIRRALFILIASRQKPRATFTGLLLLLFAMAFFNGHYLFVFFTILYVAVGQNVTANSSTYDVLDYVDQLIGSSNGGSILSDGISCSFTNNLSKEMYFLVQPSLLVSDS